MKTRLFLLPFTIAVVVNLSTISAHSQTVITFDDLHETASGSFIANGYQGLSWSNFWCLNGILYPTIFPFDTNGYYYGVVSGSNVAFNPSGDPVEIDSPGTNFNFLSAYFTGAWNSNLNIEVQGFDGTNLLYDQTVVASATHPTLFTFNYLDVNRLYFDSYGGENAGFPDGSGAQFAMDNFTFDFIPEPSSLLLAGLGVVTLWASVKRERA
jgi:PEP-CTERM motif-containing protein